MENPEHADNGIWLAQCDMVCTFCHANKATKPMSWKWNFEKGKGSTGNFNHHFSRHHGSVWQARTSEDMVARFPNCTQSEVEQATQSVIHSWAGTAFDVALAGCYKVEWIAMHNHPFTECEDPSTHQFLTHLRPGYAKHLVGGDQQKVHID
ncbi:hypothetical protein PM082_007450 [Marasmius tenuissimus]|nr:hypothetical protein PM082_007450 [Marasmius tenuissimus]